jgi:hypothetical protein
MSWAEGKYRDVYLEHEKKHGELGHFTTLTDVPKPKEFIIRIDFADADATATAAEGDESLNEDDIISDFETDDSPRERRFPLGVRNFGPLPSVTCRFRH